MARRADQTGAPPPAPGGGRASALGRAAAAWAVAGHVLPLAVAAGRMARASLLLLSAGPGATGGWVAATAAALAIGYGMGYRGFQRSYAPRVVARAAWLAGNARPWQAALAPLVAAGLLHAAPARQRRSLALVGLMVLFAAAIRLLPEVPRAGARLGVAAGLLWGAGAIAALAARAAAGRAPDVPLELPAAAPGGEGR